PERQIFGVLNAAAPVNDIVQLLARDGESVNGYVLDGSSAIVDVEDAEVVAVGIDGQLVGPRTGERQVVRDGQLAQTQRDGAGPAAVQGGCERDGVGAGCGIRQANGF